MIKGRGRERKGRKGKGGMGWRETPQNKSWLRPCIFHFTRALLGLHVVELHIINNVCSTELPLCGHFKSVHFYLLSAGPFRFIDIYGADRIVAKLQEFQSVYGEMFTPCQLLIDHAKNPSLKFHTK
jgi:hypothetical protein